MLPSYSTVDLVNESPEDDPWDLPELKDTGVKWSGEAGFHSYGTVVRPMHSDHSDSDSLTLCFFSQSWITKGR